MGVVATVRAGAGGPRPRGGVTLGSALVTVVALAVLAGCGSLPRRDPHGAVSSAAAPTPEMSFTVRADRTLVVSGTSTRSCLPRVQMVYVVRPRVLQVLLADDPAHRCGHAAPAAGHQPPVRFRIPASVDLDRAAYVDLVGPLAASPRFRLHNALARRPV